MMWCFGTTHEAAVRPATPDARIQRLKPCLRATKVPMDPRNGLIDSNKVEQWIDGPNARTPRRGIAPRVVNGMVEALR